VSSLPSGAIPAAFRAPFVLNAVHRLYFCSIEAVETAEAHPALPSLINRIAMTEECRRLTVKAITQILVALRLQLHFDIKNRIAAVIAFTRGRQYLC
jgi:hypothetical protein